MPWPLATVTSPSVSVRPFATVVSLFSSTDIIGVVPTALPSPIIKSSAESSSPI